MKNKNNLKYAARRISTLFVFKEEVKNNTLKKQNYMRINFLLFSVFLKTSNKNEKGRKEHTFIFFPFLTSKVLNSQSSPFFEIVEQVWICCTKQDLHLFPFKQFFLRNKFDMQQVIEWRLSKSMKSKKQLSSLAEVMKATPSDAFRRRFVTLIDQNKKEKEKHFLAPFLIS